MLKGFADVHVVHAIVQALRRRGMDVETAQQRGLQEADDSDLLAAALDEERVMLTNDTDFLALAARAQLTMRRLRRFITGCSRAVPLARWSGASYARQAWKIIPPRAPKYIFSEGNPGQAGPPAASCAPPRAGLRSPVARLPVQDAVRFAVAVGVAADLER